MKDFLQNRPRVPSAMPHSTGKAGGTAAPQVFDSAMLGMAGSSAGSGGHEASVEAIKEGDRVTKLIVTCKCGERIEILCAYGTAPR